MMLHYNKINDSCVKFIKKKLEIMIKFYVIFIL